MFNDNRQTFGWNNIPPVTKHLIIINVVVYLACIIVPKFGHMADMRLALHYWGSGMFNPAQLFTYMFMHGSIAHIFFNMFALLMFGRMLEMVWGPKRFLIFYIVCGVGAGLVQELVTMWQLHQAAAFLTPAQLQEIGEHGKELLMRGQTYINPNMMEYHVLMVTPCVGASGAIFGILMGFAFLFPNLPMYIWFIPIPIKAKWVVLGYALLELGLGLGGLQRGVAHFAHLGGLLFGLIVLYIWYVSGLFKGNARRN